MIVYNDIDPFVCQWLRNLVAAGHLPDGEVIEADMRKVQLPDDATTVHWFAGIGGWPLALRMDGVPDDAPVWTASLPCQPFSTAGKQRGEEDERHLWPWFRRHVAERRPAVIFGEQVASPLGRAWLATVRADLEELGYAVGAADLCAAGVGAPHIRQRLYWGAVRLADAAGKRWDRREGATWSHGRASVEDSSYASELGDSDVSGLERHAGDGGCGCESGRIDAQASGPVAEAGGASDATAHHGGLGRADWLFCRDGKWRPVEPGTFPLADWLPARVGRLRACGNAVVPQLAAEFVTAFMEAYHATASV